MNRYQASHPNLEDLLQFADGELTQRNAAQVRAHLEACWPCRTEMEGVQATIGDYVRYEKALVDATPDAPASWDGFERRLDRLIAERQTRRKRPGLVFAAALAAAAIVVSFAVLELKHPATVSAAELLQKASQKEAASARRPPRLRIVRGSHSASGAELRPMFTEAHYSWEDPLSATSFAAWRDGLADRHDEVSLREGLYQIHTSTRSSTLEEATLTLRAEDLGVESGRFQFRGSEPVEIAALPDEPVVPQVRSGPAVARAPLPIVPVTPAEELRVLAALHSAETDLGDQIDLSRDSAGRLTVTATGIAPSRRAALERALSAIPDVTVRFPQPTLDSSKPTQAESGQDRTPVPDLLPPALTGDVFEASEAAMVQAHNLRKLADRFPPAIEQQLAPNDRSILSQLRHDHAQALAARVADLDRLLSPVLGATATSPVEEPPAAPNWQAATEVVFPAAQRLDRLLTTLLTAANRPAGAVAETDRSLKQLRADLEWYRRY